MMKPEPTALQRRILTALAANRAPGFHYPGYFLELTWPRIDTREVEHALKAGAHCTDRFGNVHPAAVGVLVDSALGTTPRLVIEAGARQATVNMNVQYTGVAPCTDLTMEATLEGFFAGDAVKQAIARGVLSAAGRAVCYATGTFVVLPPPAGVTLAPLPWQRGGEGTQAPLRMDELDARERAVIEDADKALADADSARTFIELFWGILPAQTENGAVCELKIGAQIGNRVGHVQGGILFGLAQATASAAVPRHPAISSVSAWYISPGRGEALTSRSTVVHAGRSFAVVRTEITNANGTRVLEAVSNHAAREGATP